MGKDKGVGVCQVITRTLSKEPYVCYPRREIRRYNAFHPDFAFRIDGKKKTLQLLSVVGPAKVFQGKQIEGVSCFNRLRAEGDARCIEEYGERLGYIYSNSPASTIFFTAIFETFHNENVKWVNPLPFDSGTEDLVMNLASDSREWIRYFQRTISRWKPESEQHTKLSLVLQLDVISCETFTGGLKRSLDVRFACSYNRRENDGARKKLRGVRYRTDREKWVAEYNPPGKKKQKISLGEYSTTEEAARAADVGMFCFGSKGEYNFNDSPTFLHMQQLPQRVNHDQAEQVRNWAKGFARLVQGPSSPNGGKDEPHSYATFENEVIFSGSRQRLLPTVSVSEHSFSRSASNYLPQYISNSSSSASAYLEEVTDDIASADMSIPLEGPGKGSPHTSSSQDSQQIAFAGEVFPSDDFLGALATHYPSYSTEEHEQAVPDDLFSDLVDCSSPWNLDLSNGNLDLSAATWT